MPLFEIMFLLLFSVFPLLTILSSIIGGIKFKRTYIMPLITFGTFFLLLSLVTRNITEIKEGLMWVLLYTVISIITVIVTKIIIKKKPLIANFVSNATEATLIDYDYF